MSALEFPSSEKVQAVKAAAETKPIKWSKLPTGTVYAITEIKRLKVNLVSPLSVTWKRRMVTNTKVKLSQRLADDLNGSTGPAFVLHKGLKQSTSNESRQYDDYKLIEH